MAPPRPARAVASRAIEAEDQTPLAHLRAARGGVREHLRDVRGHGSDLLAAQHAGEGRHLHEGRRRRLPAALDHRGDEAGEGGGPQRRAVERAAHVALAAGAVAAGAVLREDLGPRRRESRADGRRKGCRRHRCGRSRRRRGAGAGGACGRGQAEQRDGQHGRCETTASSSVVPTLHSHAPLSRLLRLAPCDGQEYSARVHRAKTIAPP